MRNPRISAAAIPVALLLALAPAAAAEEAPLVPPGNSAVNQYTEAFPTAAGERDAHENDSLRSPRQVLGPKTTRKLRDQGSEGDAVAELTAETAPATGTGETGEGETEADRGAATGSGGGNSGGAGGAGTGGGGPDSGTNGTGGAANRVEIVAGDGPSSLGEVLSRATGVSPSGGMGIFLPLIIIVTAGWAIAYAARQRRPAG